MARAARRSHRRRRGHCGGLIVAAIAGCRGQESGWLSGFTCSSGYGYAAAIGGLYGATLGSALGILRGGGAWHAGGDAGVPLLMSGIGALVGSIFAGVLVETTQQPTLSLIGGGALSVLFATVGGVIGYDASRPSLAEDRPRNALTFIPVVTPVEGGAVVSVAGITP